MKNYALVLLVLVSIIFTSCKKESKNLKFDDLDLFTETMAKSQFFEIDLAKDTTIVGEKGTKIVIPRNAFTLNNGQSVRKIKFELSEALTLDEIILSNLTTTSNEKLLETDGMIYINATSNGENLIVDSNNPLYIEIPTKNKKPNMMVYKGIRDSVGNMNWIEPKKLNQYLIPVDLELLDFLPEGFEQEAINYLSYYKKDINKKSIDSLYYTLLNKCKNNYDKNSDGILNNFNGFDPSEIKTIKNIKFNNTIISTREFEERLKYIRKTCNSDFLDVYINNLNSDLWKIDSLIVDKLNLYNKLPIVQIRTEEYDELITRGLIFRRERRVIDTIGYRDYSEIKQKIIQFKNQKLTNIEFKSIYINQLKGFYNTKLRENIQKADSLRKIVIEEKENSKVRLAYKKLLNEREKITMQFYGFEQTETGWINIDTGVIPKNWNYQPVELLVKNKTKFDQIHAYLLFSTSKSLVKLNSFNNTKFSLEENKIPITKNSNIKAIVFALKGGAVYYAIKDFVSKKDNSENTIVVKLKESSLKSFKNDILKLNFDGESNNVIKDLEFSIVIKKEENLKRDLLKAAFPCCTN